MEHTLTSAWAVTGSDGPLVLSSEDTKLSIALQSKQAATVAKLLAGWEQDDDSELEPLRNELIRRGILRPLAVSPVPEQDRQIEYWRAFTGDARHAVERLRTATVTIVGVGGIGSIVLQHLVGAGVTRFRLLDGDTVEASNLNRQFIYARSSIGESKVNEASSDVTERVGGGADVSVRAEMWDPDSPDQQEFVLRGVDFVIAAIDKPSISASIEVLDAAWSARIPAILATVGLNRSLVSQVFLQDLSPRAPRETLLLSPASTSDSTLLASHGPTNTMPAAIAADQALQHIAGLSHRVNYERPLIIRRAPDGAPLASRVSRIKL
jgi:molybdopterin/thiamine biosynthesis adenylyltransferase